MDQLSSAFRYLARRYSARWSRLDDALARLRAVDGEKTDDGEKARRMLRNAFRNHTYLDSIRDTAATDRANALRALGKPMSEALGHLITIEMADHVIAEVSRAEKERLRQLSAADADARNSAFSPLINALHRQGIHRGAYSVLSDVELRAIAKYIAVKVNARAAALPVPRGAAESRAAKQRLHPIWNAFRTPHRDD